MSGIGLTDGDKRDGDAEYGGELHSGGPEPGPAVLCGGRGQGRGWVSRHRDRAVQGVQRASRARARAYGIDDLPPALVIVILGGKKRGRIAVGGQLRS